MTSTTSMKFDSPVRRAIEQFASEGGALPTRQAGESDRPGAAQSQQVGASITEFIPYGPPGADGAASCEILATLGEIELEYAAIRRSAAVFDAPHRGTILVTGADRRDFLNRMLTQDFRAFPAGAVTESFWLNRKGRIDADLLVAELGEAILIDLDITSAAATATALENFVFSEDVQVRDVSRELHRIHVHGPTALDAVAAATGQVKLALEPFHATTLQFGDAPVHVVRRDIAGTVGLHITLAHEHAGVFWKQLVAREADNVRGRAIGWYALNIARIEAGTPIFNIDFGPNNLPHETGIVAQRVSFTKGCYIGQEIVARMQNLGAPKQQLVGLAMQSDHLPTAGGAVFEIAEDQPGNGIGMITSSTLSPMCSAQAIAFAMLRSASAALGTEVIVHAEGEEARGQVHPLTFWTSEGGAP